MPKGKSKSKYDFKNNSCLYEASKRDSNNWCNLPKYMKCEHVIRVSDGSKACLVKS